MKNIFYLKLVLLLLIESNLAAAEKDQKEFERLEGYSRAQLINCYVHLQTAGTPKGNGDQSNGVGKGSPKYEAVKGFYQRVSETKTCDELIGLCCKK